jgi:hypothetical protein
VIRKRSDNVKPGRGIDGTEGENYTKEYARSTWDHPSIGGEDINPKGHGKYTSDESGLRNKAPGAGTGGTGESLQGGSHDIWDDVNKNSNSGTDKTGPIKYGVD